MKILFIMNHIPNPRINKRIELLKNNKIEIICIRRKDSDIWNIKYKDIKHHIFDKKVPNSNFFRKRLLFSLEYIFKMKKYINNFKPDIIYTEGLEALIGASLFKRNRNIAIIYEVADLRESYLENKLKNKVINRIAKWFYKKINILVLTSEKFYSEYFYKYIAKNKMVVIPNIPETKIFEGFKRKENGKFTVGFIGGIRYLNQIKMLIDVSEELDINILLAGAGGTKEEYQEIQKYCQNKENVIMTGKYDYHKEIKGLYERVDCVYSVYDSTNPNVKIALPNKLYEAIYCELPIIVAKDTYLEEIVNRLRVGKAIENKAELKTLLEKWKNKEKDYLKILENCKNNKEMIDIDKYNKLLLEKILRKGENFI